MRKKSIVLRTAVVCLLTAASTFAQQPAQQTPAPIPVPAPAAAQPSQPLTEYAQVRNARSHAEVGVAGRRGRLIVGGGGLHKLLDAAGGECADIILFPPTMPRTLTPATAHPQEGPVPRYLL